MNKIKCAICGKEFSPKIKTQVYCSSECRKIATHRANQETKRLKSIELYKNTPGIAVCRECGFMGHDLFTHIRFAHNLTTDQYCEKYNCTKEDLLSKQTHETRSLAQKNSTNPNKKRFTSENNPMKGVTDGRNSPYSKNFSAYKGLTDKEINERISVVTKKATQSKIENASCPMYLEYYLKQGLSEEEAKKALSTRQSTFSKLKCIEKLGEEEGTKRWLDRQEKWQATLNSKPPEELERIYKAKSNNGSGWSKISQELFLALDKLLEDYKLDTYFATKFRGRQNGEWFVPGVPGVHRPYFLDFCLPDYLIVIEFDGDYWHGEKRGNQQRDAEKDQNLLAKGYKILHVRERDFRVNRDNIIHECFEFILQNIKC